MNDFFNALEYPVSTSIAENALPAGTSVSWININWLLQFVSSDENRTGIDLQNAAQQSVLKQFNRYEFKDSKASNFLTNDRFGENGIISSEQENEHEEDGREDVETTRRFTHISPAVAKNVVNAREIKFDVVSLNIALREAGVPLPANGSAVTA